MIDTLKIDWARMAAKAFVRNKDRLPESLDELGLWLMEFAKYESERADRYERLLIDELMTRPPRPIIAVAQPPTPAPEGK